MTVEPVADTIVEELGRLWAEHDLDELTSDAVKYLTAGSATDWGMPATIQSPVTPISLGGGIPDPDTLPRAELLAAMDRALDVPDDTPLRYGGGVGYEPLRDALAQRYTRDRHVPVTAEHFLLTNGSAGAIDLVCAAFLSPGDTVISEAPTFSGTLRTFKGRQANIISVGMDEEGLDTTELARVLADLESQGKRAKLIYTISNFHNPAGTSMSLARRYELLRLAAKHGALIVDDDAYGEFFYSDDRPITLSELANVQGVITVSTFSKIMATGLRVGWVHAEPAVIDRVMRMRFEMGNSPLLHHMIYNFMEDGRLDEHIEQMRKVYSQKLNALTSALHEYCEPYMSFRKPEGGFFLWATLQNGLTARDVQREAVMQGVNFPIGHAFFADHQDPGEHIRLAFSWVALDDIPEAARRLAVACARVAEGVA
ncbi:MAG: PLP-dependent aminotransferase family protein [Chloroflexi bacterium]|nr:PLP-dependent aminotransferase family protein [Chloroflexota bacterium]MDA1145838.1 PLP-dependent aminotransferase family protein [Chloroflexota bacterium]